MAGTSHLHLLGSKLNLAHLLEASKQDLVRLLGNPDKKKVSHTTLAPLYTLVLNKG